MTEEDISQEITLRNINKKINYFIEEINQNKLMSKKHKIVYGVLNYTENLLILVSTVTGRVSISYFVFLVGIPVATSSSAAELKIYLITLGIKKYKSIIKKKKKKHDKIVLLAKTKSNVIDIF